jgi:pyruvate formate lyase activating enzyme
LERTPIETLQKAYKIGKDAGLFYVYMGNAGLENNTTCKKCGEVLLDRITYNTIKDNRKNGVLMPKIVVKNLMVCFIPLEI